MSPRAVGLVVWLLVGLFGAASAASLMIRLPAVAAYVELRQ